MERPSGASTPWRLESTKRSVVDSTVTPPARAMAHSPSRTACTARCRATSEEEHAVSTVSEGPSRPSR